jgi:hypothetical protein
VTERVTVSRYAAHPRRRRGTRFGHKPEPLGTGLAGPKSSFIELIQGIPHAWIGALHQIRLPVGVILTPLGTPLASLIGGLVPVVNELVVASEPPIVPPERSPLGARGGTALAAAAGARRMTGRHGHGQLRMLLCRWPIRRTLITERAGELAEAVSACGSRFHRVLRRIGVHSRPGDVHSGSNLVLWQVGQGRCRRMPMVREQRCVHVAHGDRASTSGLSVPCGAPRCPRLPSHWLIWIEKKV